MYACLCSGGQVVAAFVPFDQDSIKQHHSGKLHRLGDLHRYCLCELLTCIQIHPTHHGLGLIKQIWEPVYLPYINGEDLIFKNQ